MVLTDTVPYSAQRRSVELFAERVIPHFRDQFSRRLASRDWTLNEFGGGRDKWEAAIAAATTAYAGEGGEAAKTSVFTANED